MTRRIYTLTLDMAAASPPETVSKLYLATVGFTSAAGHTPAGTHYRERIADIVVVTEMPGGGDGHLLAGRLAGFAEVLVSNADGGLDTIIGANFIDGRIATLAYADVADDAAPPDPASFTTAFRGYAAGWGDLGAQLRIRIADVSVRAHVQAQTNTYAGTGQHQGEAELEGLGRPLSYGILFNVAPQLVDDERLIYQVHDGRIGSIGQARTGGIAYSQAADRSTYTGLRDASLASGSFGTCLWERSGSPQRGGGWLRLGATPTDEVTCDLTGAVKANPGAQEVNWDSGFAWDSGFGWTSDAPDIGVDTHAGVIYSLLKDRAGLVDTTEIDTATFAALETAHPAKIGWHLPAGSDRTVADCAFEIARSGHMVTGPRRTGEWTIRYIDQPGTPTVTVEHVVKDSLQKLELPFGGVTRFEARVPWNMHRCMFKRNWTVQRSLLPGASETAKRVYAKTSNLARSLIDDDIRTVHRGSQPVTWDTLLVERDDAEAFNAARAAFYALGVECFRARAHGIAWQCEPGTSVTLVHPTHGLSAGRDGIVLRVEELPLLGPSGLTEITVLLW